MASKVKKTTTTATFTSQSTPGSETPSTSAFSPRRRERPPSPARTTRQQEKEDLQGLNDRLANYIDKVRYLEAENNRLSTQIQSTEETVKREVSSVKNLYENELSDARKVLDETAKEKARVQIEASTFKTKYEDLLAKYKQRDREASAAEQRVENLEAQLSDLTAKLNDADAARARLQKDINGLRSQLSSLEQQLGTAKQQIEEETLLRVDLENRVQSLKEELQFKAQLYEQELEEVRVRSTTKLEETDGRLEEEYDRRLLDALQEMRADYETKIQTACTELENIYQTKINDLKTQAERSNTASESAFDELSITRKRCDDLAAQLSKLKAENAGFEQRFGDLENQLERERNEFHMRLAQKDDELADLRLTLEEHMQEYSDLLDIKIRLDREIAAYSKLLESEETRLNISLDSSQGSQASRSPGRTPAGRGAKRKRVEVSEDVREKSSTSGYAHSSSASGAMQISEVDPEGKFIKLTNTGSKDTSLGSWQVKHVAGDQETAFKFHRSLVVKADSSVTVWSSDTETTHSPPTDVVMKGKRWFVGDEMKTTLFNSDEEEVANCSMSKSSLRSVSSYTQRHSGPRDEVDATESVEREKCLVM